MTSGIVPRSVDDVARLARMAHASGLAKVQSPEAAGVIIMAGMELGLTPMQALMGMHLVEGRPTLAADTLVALVMRRTDVCELWRITERTAERCTIETRRKGHETVRRTWTLEDAKRAGLLTRKPWLQYPADMLRHRCATAIAREVYPDVVLGFYDREELAEEPSPAVPMTVSVTHEIIEAPALSAHAHEHEPAQQPANDAPPAVDEAAVRQTFEALRAALDATKTKPVDECLRAIVSVWRGMSATVKTLPEDARKGLWTVARECVGSKWGTAPDIADAWLRAALKTPASEPTPLPIRTSKKETLPTAEAVEKHYEKLTARKHLEAAARAHGAHPWVRPVLIKHGVTILETDASDVAQTIDAWALKGREEGEVAA